MKKMLISFCAFFMASGLLYGQEDQPVPQEDSPAFVIETCNEDGEVTTLVFSAQELINTMKALVESECDVLPCEQPCVKKCGCSIEKSCAAEGSCCGQMCDCSESCCSRPEASECCQRACDSMCCSSEDRIVCENKKCECTKMPEKSSVDSFIEGLEDDDIPYEECKRSAPSKFQVYMRKVGVGLLLKYIAFRNFMGDCWMRVKSVVVS